MFGLALGFLLMVRGFKRAWQDAQFRASAMALLILLGASTVFFTLHEDWALIDAIYFSVVSVTTVGFGDYTPETDLGKIFTIFYLILGIGTAVSFVASLGAAVVAERAEATYAERGPGWHTWKDHATRWLTEHPLRDADHSAARRDTTPTGRAQ